MNLLKQMTTINTQRKQDGFTVTEIVIVMAIMGILGAFAVPSFLAWLPGYQLKSAIRDLQGHLQTAKYEAVQRGGNVAVVFTAGAFSPTGGVGSYLVFVDTNGDFVLDAGEVSLIQVNMPNNVSLTGATANVRFTSRGIPNVGAIVTLRNRDTWGQAVITAVGRVNIQRSTDGVAYQQWD
jgi:prepilin-type N-terminal cleavage/methylation domain-containing protein